MRYTMCGYHGARIVFLRNTRLAVSLLVPVSHLVFYPTDLLLSSRVELLVDPHPRSDQFALRQGCTLHNTKPYQNSTICKTQHK